MAPAREVAEPVDALREDALPLAAVDIGNSRVKLGVFEHAPPTSGLPDPSFTLRLTPGDDAFNQVEAWLGGRPASGFEWRIGSVQRSICTRLVEWLRGQGVDQIMLLAAFDLDMEVRLPRPDMVGIDRLLGAFAANRLRRPGSPAVVVDLGSAITVDLVSPEGAFLGGAILPGISMAARALHQFTDLLPLLDMFELSEPPDIPATTTADALRAGIYWGAVGGVRHLIERLADRVGCEPDVFLTGGAAPNVAPLLSARAMHVPHLTLAGIALTQEPRRKP